MTFKIHKTDNRSVVNFAVQGLNADGYGNHWTRDMADIGYFLEGALPYNLANLLAHRRLDPFTFRRNKNIRQIIYSYRTPIAWLDGTQWVIPSVSYSVTTAKHQGYLWKLPNAVRIPWDISIDEYIRVIEGKMRFTGNGTVPGPNYVEGE